MTLDIEGAVKHTENVYSSVWLDQVCNAVVAVEQDADVVLALIGEAEAALGKAREAFGPLVNATYRPLGCRGIIPRDVRVDFAQPGHRFVGPPHPAHAVIIAPTSS